jgi:hypothetical protein
MAILVTYFYLSDYYLRIIVRNTVDGVMIILFVLSVVDIVFLYLTNMLSWVSIVLSH